LFHVKQLGYDPENSETTITELGKQVPDLECWEVPQFMSHLNAPTKWVLGAYENELFMHAKNPVLGFNARNVTMKHDADDNIKPVKAVNKQSKKIDGFSALIDAAHRAHTISEETYVYDGYLKR